jgi:membrane-bound lytic murein transglycosylase D
MRFVLRLLFWVSQPLNNKKAAVLLGLVFGLTFTGLPLNSWAVGDPFPVYPSIRPNIEFWKSVYAQYSSKQGILHDNRNLNLIYGVIKLRHPDAFGARKINRERIKLSKNKYRQILKSLAHGHPPQTSEAAKIAKLFGPKAKKSDFRRAAGQIRCQTGLKDRFRKGIMRSGAYLKKIQQIFKQKKLPTDLSYLPHVESSFNPNAYSKFGAAGAWQFVRSTGRRYMRVDYVVDERRDPILSSYAAASLLSDNYERLGSWPLALTAYNHGANGMARAKRLNGGYEAIFNHYNGRRFKFASRNFYSEFLAARDVAKNYQRYFGKLKFEKPAAYTVIKMPGYVNVIQLSNHLDVNVEKIRRLNPSLRKPIFRAEKYIPKGFDLRLPLKASRKQTLTTAGIPSELIRSKQKRSRFHRVEKGDTTGKIARLHSVSIRELARANNLNSRATIYAGQNLIIPAFGKTSKNTTSKKPVEKKVVAMKTKKPVKEKVVVMKEEKPVKAAALIKTTRPPPSPEPEVKINPRVVTGDFRVKREKKKGAHTGVIRVAVAETLGHYADWLNIPTQSIRRINGFRYGQVLRINQKVKIPLKNITKAEFEEKRLEYHQEVVQDFFNVYRVDQVQTYHIKRGDNIWSLCKEDFEVPLWLFLTYNEGLDLKEIQASQPVKIPVLEKITSS